MLKRDPISTRTVYPKKYAHSFCFAVLCCGYTLTDFPISIRLTSLALWQSNDFPSASKATLMHMDKYFMWIYYERLHNHNKAKHNKTVCIFCGIYCIVDKNLHHKSYNNHPIYIQNTWQFTFALEIIIYQSCSLQKKNTFLPLGSILLMRQILFAWDIVFIFLCNIYSGRKIKLHFLCPPCGPWLVKSAPSFELEKIIISHWNYGVWWLAELLLILGYGWLTTPHKHVIANTCRILPSHKMC